jgi:hypothetical protein
VGVWHYRSFLQLQFEKISLRLSFFLTKISKLAGAKWRQNGERTAKADRT